MFQQGDVIRFMERRTLRSKCPPLAGCLQRGMCVLDVGSSIGAMTTEVARLVAPGDVTGVDVAPKAIEDGRKAAAERGPENLRFQVADTYDLPFEDDEFDLTYSLALMVWLRDPVTALIEQKRVTRRGGWVAAGTGD
ncbi:2-methoxy-6-polyprenyl-1,4-benzoquinol methylase [subsurface metagenome]